MIVYFILLKSLKKLGKIRFYKRIFINECKYLIF
jgi:hypothetical protein